METLDWIFYALLNITYEGDATSSLEVKMACCVFLGFFLQVIKEERSKNYYEQQSNGNKKAK